MFSKLSEKKKIVLTLLAALLVLTGIFVVANLVRDASQAQQVEVSAPRIDVIEPVGVSVAPTTTMWKPIDLTGQWSTDTANPKMIAHVKDGTVLVNFVSDDATMIYWNGTLANPKQGESIITSQRIEIKKATLSGAPSKEFTYHDEKLSFEFSAMGKTKVVVMTRG